jgi:hypothetical protein
VAIVGEIEKFDTKYGPGFVFKAGKKDAPFDEFQGYKHVWKLNQSMREMVAKAINRNHANDPTNFPADKLEVYRHPPRPTLKTAPMP